MSLLVVGSVAFDTVETSTEKRENLIGGTANYACLAASMFTGSRMVGVIGEDYPQKYIDIMKERNVDTEGLIVAKGETFRWGGVYSEDFSERTTLFTHLNVFEQFQPELPESYKNSSFVFLGNIQPTLQIHVLDQMEAPTLVGCDTMNLWIDTALDDLKKLLPRVDIVFINDEEARMLSRKSNLVAAAAEVLDMGPRMVIIKRGEHGASIYGKEFEFHSPAFPVSNVVDPTGAGDCFAGGFMGYIAMRGEADERQIRRAMIAGGTMGSYCVEEFGVERLLELDDVEINSRFAAFGSLTDYDKSPLI